MWFAVERLSNIMLPALILLESVYGISGSTACLEFGASAVFRVTISYHHPLKTKDQNKPVWVNLNQTSFDPLFFRSDRNYQNRFRSKLGQDLTWTHQVDSAQFRSLLKTECWGQLFFSISNMILLKTEVEDNIVVCPNNKSLINDRANLLCHRLLWLIELNRMTW